MLDFEIIQRALSADDEQLSLNIDDQRVNIDGRHLKRTVYRAHFEGRDLFGSVLIKGEWHRYKLQPSTQHWAPAPKPAKAIPIDRLIDRAEKNLRDLNKAELHRLAEHYRGHPHHWRRYAVALELTRRCNDPQPEAKKVAECDFCSDTFQVTSPAYLFRTGRDHCPTCDMNRRVRAVDPPKQSKEQRIHREERREANWENLKRGRR